MNSVYYENNPNIDLRWDNDLYGQFDNSTNENISTNNISRNRKSKFNFKYYLRLFLWVVLITIVIMLIIKMLMYYSGNRYPFIDLVNNKFCNLTK